jgi:2-polyprenyl-6-methoxyphenol hydroxylase-like FAD-dependent oxidoreductase
VVVMMARVPRQPEHTDVLVVGSGPTGLTAAIRLAQLHIPFVLLDAAPAPSRTSKASLVQAATLELLAELGVGDQLVAAGRRIHHIRMIDRGSTLLSVPLTGLPTAYPFGLTVPLRTTAAHVHSPAGGQGMNTRIADAFDLSTRLAAVLTGRAGEIALDQYEQARRPAALEVLRFIDRLTRISMLHNPAARRIRWIVARTLGRRKSVQRRVTMSISGPERSPLHHLPPVTTSQTSCGPGKRS